MSRLIISFNPRPSLRTGATTAMVALPAQDVFQSSPVTKDGRYVTITLRRGRCSRFQSSPVTKDGRYGSFLGHRGSGCRFQSSPVTKDGRYPSQAVAQL